MTEKRGRGRPPVPKSTKEGFVEEVTMDIANPSVNEETPLSESQLARIRLRKRWELASVLNFLHVFKPVLKIGFEVSGEEIETALITPNGVLAELHISLLKGTPPIGKNLTIPDAWVTLLCKKLAMWWPWVGEGKIPLVASNGEEIGRYKDLDPTVRLVLLKALCEVRADQVDVLSYISDELKKGTQISTFRKNRIAEDGNGTSYWYDGDSDIGFRLYKEVIKVEVATSSPGLKGKGLGKGCSRQPTNSFQWETLATNLDEFLQISIKLSSCKADLEASVGKVVESEIIPVLENLQKKKERALKRQQKQAMLLSGCLNSYRTGSTRSQRNCKPVSYTFDDYDRSIDEAIQLNKKSKRSVKQKKHGGKDDEHGGRNGVSLNGSTVQNRGPIESDDDFEKLQGRDGSDDDDNDYDDKNDNHDSIENTNDSDDDDSIENTSSEKENKNLGYETHQRVHLKKRKGLPVRDVTGLRRSMRTAGHTSHPYPNIETRSHANKITLRQRSTSVTASRELIVSDSEDENLIIRDSEDEHSSGNANGNENNPLVVLDGLLDGSEE